MRDEIGWYFVGFRTFVRDILLAFLGSFGAPAPRPALACTVDSPVSDVDSPADDRACSVCAACRPACGPALLDKLNA